MAWVDRIRTLKTFLVLIAIAIAVVSLVVSNSLVRDLQQEEAKSMEVWAEAMRSLNMADEYTDLNLVLKVINGNEKIPVVVLDSAGTVLDYRNVDLNAANAEDSMLCVVDIVKKMRENGYSLKIFLDYSELDNCFEDDNSGMVDSALLVNGGLDKKESKPQDYIEICYDDSLLLKRLASYPYIQLIVVIVFVLVAFFALFSSMKAEQNKVWVGLSKETAHQLGTPISSLMAWVEVLRETYPNDDLIPEMSKDVSRLEGIADRFSKIGSIPEPRVEKINAVLMRVVEYIRNRVSSKVVITTHFPENDVEVLMVAPLFEWVAENLCKNAVDAMSGSGNIDIYIYDEMMYVALEFVDTGRGMSKRDFKTVFKPGFTTKSRGWGLGLSLAKRIVEKYHNGRIFVKRSELGVGTTFRVEMPKGV